MSAQRIWRGWRGLLQEEVVAMGSHVMRVRCDEWFLRQPPGVQVLCLGVVAGFVVFGLSAWGNFRRSKP